MPMHPVFGHHERRHDLSLALRAGRLPQVMLFTGAPGIGKQRLALWLAQRLFCSGPSGDEPCGTCRPCRLTLDLAHPDLHWFVPIPRPRAGDPDKQVEEVRDTLGDLMAARREQPVYRRPDGMAMHGVGTARLLLRLTVLTTVEGGRRVVVIGDADRLVPQESSPEAANALLKLLEEPPASTVIILTAADPGRVLPTIRSRAVQVRVGRLSDAEVEAALTALRPDDGIEDRKRRVRQAGGALGLALEDGVSDALADQVVGLLEDARRGGPRRFERVLRQGPWAARGEFTMLLDGLADALGQAARAAATGHDRESLPAPIAGLVDPERAIRALARVEAAREAAQGNVNPQLLLAGLTNDLEETLWA